jgi:hypothetical protein
MGLLFKGAVLEVFSATNIYVDTKFKLEFLTVGVSTPFYTATSNMLGIKRIYAKALNHLPDDTRSESPLPFASVDR